MPGRFRSSTRISRSGSGSVATRGFNLRCAGCGFLRTESASGQRPDLDVPERNRKLLILKPELPLGKAAVVDVERRFTVQHDDEMIAVRGDLVTIPVVGLERMLARGLRGSDDGAGVVAGRLLPPDLDFVAAAFLRGAHENAAVRVRIALEFDRQREVLVAAIRGQITCRRPARAQ